MACDITQGRDRVCKNNIGGNSVLYLFNYLEDPFTILAGECTAMNVLLTEAFKFEIEGDLNPIEESMAGDLASFHNDLNAFVIELKQQKSTSSFEKGIWIFEGFLLLVSMFIAGMWYQNPKGNYEPILVGLALITSLIALWLKFGRK